MWAVPAIYPGSVGYVAYNSLMESRQRQLSIALLYREAGSGRCSQECVGSGKGNKRMGVAGAWFSGHSEGHGPVSADLGQNKSLG